MTKTFELAFIAPFPAREQVLEGWMSRIYTIDQAFLDLPRVYIHVDIHIDGDDQKLVWMTENSAVQYLNPDTESGKSRLDLICRQVSAIYCHTLHLAEYVLDYLESGKVCVDIHGVTPEEEEMMGNPENVVKYTEIEQAVLAKAKVCVMVTDSMANHYYTKYPKINFNWAKLCIFEKYTDLNADLKNDKPESELPVNTIYAGGTQAWQQIDTMINAMKLARGYSNFTILSHEYQRILNMLPIDFSGALECSFCPKEQLPEKYSVADFGFIIREDTAVNRVACPTKLIEYLCFGVIPIVDLVEIGDFAGYGYEYISVDDFTRGMIPDRLSRQWMIEKNLKVAEKMSLEFDNSLVELRSRVLLATY